VNKHKTTFILMQHTLQYNSALTVKVARHSQQMFKMSVVCSDTLSRSESTGRRSGLWRSCSSAV